MTECFLTAAELSFGPDLLRPGSRTARLGQGRVAFIYTKHADPEGKRFFTAPASAGHETMITQENVVQALFGPDLTKLMGTITYTQDQDQSGIRKPHYDHLEIRRLSRDTNLYGRYGTVRGRGVLMLWQRNEGWEPMLEEVIKELQLPDETILTAGTEEIGSVETFKSDLRANQDG